MSNQAFHYYLHIKGQAPPTYCDHSTICKVEFWCMAPSQKPKHHILESNKHLRLLLSEYWELLVVTMVAYQQMTKKTLNRAFMTLASCSIW